jgi:hypothetical protein
LKETVFPSFSGDLRKIRSVSFAISRSFFKLGRFYIFQILEIWCGPGFTFSKLKSTWRNMSGSSSLPSILKVRNRGAPAYSNYW